ncbi:MAG: hypothetical protein JXP73_10265 [Deltaproteobacteria bacterium]|nr:hypothetical protein [Deltaproteobacteria bacterium]
MPSETSIPVQFTCADCGKDATVQVRFTDLVAFAENLKTVAPLSWVRVDPDNVRCQACELRRNLARGL